MTLALLLVMNIAFGQHYMTSSVTQYEQVGSGNRYTLVKVLSGVIASWDITNDYIRCDLFDASWPVRKVTNTKEGKKYEIDIDIVGMWVIVSGNTISYYDNSGQVKQVYKIVSKRPIN